MRPYQLVNLSTSHLLTFSTFNQTIRHDSFIANFTLKNIFMSTLINLEDLLKHEIMDLYSAEEQIIEALPKMIENANNGELKNALSNHLKVTKTQKSRLDQVKKLLGTPDEDGEEKGFFSRLFSGSEKCKGTEGLIEEGEKMMGEDMSPEVMDAAIIASAQKIEHYEIASYGTARAFARELNLPKVVALLEETLNEEYNSDDLLTSLAVGRLNTKAEMATDLEGGSTREANTRRSGSNSSKGGNGSSRVSSNGNGSSSQSRSGNKSGSSVKSSTGGRSGSGSRSTATKSATKSSTNSRSNGSPAKSSAGNKRSASSVSSNKRKSGSGLKKTTGGRAVASKSAVKSSGSGRSMTKSATKTGSINKSNSRSASKGKSASDSGNRNKSSKTATKKKVGRR